MSHEQHVLDIRSASTREQFKHSLKSWLFECDTAGGASEILLYEDAPYKFAFFFFFFFFFYFFFYYYYYRLKLRTRRARI